MKSSSVKFNTISSILITHLHGDHCFGLFGLLCTVASQGRVEPVVLVGPRGLRNMVTAVLGAAGGFTGFPLRFLELEPERSYPDLGLVSSGVRLEAYPLKHRVASFGYVLREGLKPGPLDVSRAKQAGASGKQLGQLKEGRDVVLDDGRVVRSSECVGPPVRARKIALLQDTYDSTSAAAACQDLDLLIHECTYSSGMLSKALAHGHSTSGMVGHFAAQVNAKMVAMTHFSNRYETRDQTRLNAMKREALQRTEAVAEAAPVEKKQGGKQPKSKNNVDAAASVEAQMKDLTVSGSSASSSSSSSTCSAGALPASSDSVAASSPGTSAPVDGSIESDVLTLDELVAEALSAYISSHALHAAPPGGIHAAEDFLAIESMKEEFRVLETKDRLVADYELVGLRQELLLPTNTTKQPKQGKSEQKSEAITSSSVSAASVAATSTHMLL
jgi:ribonuclease Z